MEKLYLMVTIITRNLGEKYLNFYLEQKQEVQLVTLGRGTANEEALDYFGLESHEKAVLFSIVSKERWTELRKGLRKKLQIDLPGAGAAFIIPLSSIGGRGVFKYLTRTLEREEESPGKQQGAEDAEAGRKEESAVEEAKYEMIIAVANQGYIEPIMAAARSVGAGGGTVIHAKGTGMEGMGKFFGVSLAAEKEMIFIVTGKEKKNEIMRAIMEKAGMDSKARTFLFSVPVTSVAGVNLSPDTDE